MAHTASSLQRPQASVGLDFNPPPVWWDTDFSEAFLKASDCWIDRDTLDQNLAEASASAASDTDFRSAAVPVLMTAYNTARDAIAAFNKAHPLDTLSVVRGYTLVADTVIQAALKALVDRRPKDSQVFAVAAVGGYGRGEMAPHSDIDLLFLVPPKSPDWTEQLVEELLYILWDLRLKVGHATRNVAECLELSKTDGTIRTALLESRYLAGDEAKYSRLTKTLEENLFKTTGPEFVELKLAEREERHLRQGGQRYMLEPNVKEGKGGLRDLQSMFWITKYLSGARDNADMLRLGYFTEAELASFNAAEHFLWTVRCHLHLALGRASEQLTFDAQVDVADRLGYRDADGRRAVELFMQDYFRHATLAGDLTRIFLTKLEAENIKKRPSIGARLASMIWSMTPDVPEGFVYEHGRLNLADPEAFFKDPVNIMRVFEEALRSDILIHANLMREIAARLDLIDDQVRQDPVAIEIFLRTLLDYGNPERALRRMNELGVLGKFIPEFGRIIAMMQFNHYHHYTVDEHTIQCVRVLAQIERGELIEDLPIVSEILERGVNRKVLFVALLLHDIGKGLPEDHSVAGARIAAEIAPRLGLDEDETETVTWLVREHLTMSDVAQKRDLSDPRTVRDFAHKVRSRRRLNLLTALTVCDISGVGPGTLNQWKTQLLRSLYKQTQAALQGGLDSVGDFHRDDEARETLSEYLDAGWTEAEREKELDRHYAPYWQGLDAFTHRVFAEMLRKITADEIEIDISNDEDRSASRACFALQDHPGIFSRLSGALALVGANVVDARSYTSKDGYATAVFWIQNAERKPFEIERIERLKQMILKSLTGKVIARDAIKERDKIKKREREFLVPTEINFDNEGSEIYTIIEVDTRDRPGLLYDLTRTLAASNIYIASSLIATYGAQAVDVFYVKDMFGLKLHSKSKRKVLEEKLRAAIAAGAERAVQ